MRNISISRRALAALIGACLFQCALVGVLINSNGVFMAAIRESTGMPMTMISANTSIRTIVCAVTSVPLTTMFYKGNMRRVMFGSILAVVANYLLMIVCTGNILWYVIPALSCPVSTIGLLAVPHILRQWFPEHSGTATGAAMAFSGLGGVVFNPVAAALCTSCGWQTAIVIMGAIMVVMAAVGVRLCFGSSKIPAEAAAPSREEPVLEGLRISVPARFTLLVIMLFSCSVTVLVSYISVHVGELGYPLAAGAAVTSFAMFGNIGGKVVFGWLTDKLGIWKTMTIASAMVCVGSGMLSVVRNSLPMMYLAALLYGVSYYCAAIAISRACPSVYGTELNKKYIGTHVTLYNVVAAVLAFSAGPIFEYTGSFAPIFAVVSVACAAAAVTAAVFGVLFSRQAQTAAC